jgi:hypothetical protein
VLQNAAQSYQAEMAVTELELNHRACKMALQAP